MAVAHNAGLDLHDVTGVERQRGIMREADPAIPLFSTDFPHVEGGRNPVKRFEATLGGIDAEGRARFYRQNFEDLMGPALRGLPAAA